MVDLICAGILYGIFVMLAYGIIHNITNYKIILQEKYGNKEHDYNIKYIVYNLYYFITSFISGIILFGLLDFIIASVLNVKEQFAKDFIVVLLVGVLSSVILFALSNLINFIIHGKVINKLSNTEFYDYKIDKFVNNNTELKNITELVQKLNNNKITKLFNKTLFNTVKYNKENDIDIKLIYLKNKLNKLIGLNNNKELNDIINNVNSRELKHKYNDKIRNLTDDVLKYLNETNIIFNSQVEKDIKKANDIIDEY